MSRLSRSLRFLALLTVALLLYNLPRKQVPADSAIMTSPALFPNTPAGTLASDPYLKGIIHAVTSNASFSEAAIQQYAEELAAAKGYDRDWINKFLQGYHDRAEELISSGTGK